MANKLAPEKKSSVISMLAEGNSIRAVERITGVNQNTIMSLIRSFLLKETQIERVIHLGRIFQNVFTPAIRLDLRKRKPPSEARFTAVNGVNLQEVSRLEGCDQILGACLKGS